MIKIIPRLDVMIAYSCNISCVGCISMSDFKRDGVASYADIESWILHWHTMIAPEVVTLFGGEPCLHPRLPEICALVRQHWPDTVIRLITNGYLLDNFDSQTWFEHAPMEIQVSVHRKDHEAVINQRIKNILDQRSGWTVHRSNKTAHEQLSWQLGNFRIYKSIFKDFVVPFYQTGKAVLPWYSDPAEAHAICGAPNTPILYKGKLYKCPAVANAMDITGQNWFDYSACSDQNQLNEFVAGIGKPELVCGQCPNKTQAVIIDHFDTNNVIVKQKNIS
jgi:hypothetical protein